MPNQKDYSLDDNRSVQLTESLSSIGKEIVAIKKELNSLPDKEKKMTLLHLENISQYLTTATESFQWMEKNNQQVSSETRRKETAL